HYKLLAFTLSAAVAGLAGGLKVLVVGVASLTDVHWHANGEVVLMALLGGIGTVFGPLVGALTFVSLQNYLAPLGSWVLIVQGAIFVLCVLLFRDGIMGLLARGWLAMTRAEKKGV
ncbi:MAG: branched-chain amino acid ABC transporter permease, partial [Alphaproteobacteria bacterium]|nr:branched-chain amino acid ABC transporter permease [Alphaproteobacteria bacterium]